MCPIYTDDLTVLMQTETSSTNVVTIRWHHGIINTLIRLSGFPHFSFREMLKSPHAHDDMVCQHYLGCDTINVLQDVEAGMKIPLVVQASHIQTKSTKMKMCLISHLPISQW